MHAPSLCLGFLNDANPIGRWSENFALSVSGPQLLGPRFEWWLFMKIFGIEIKRYAAVIIAEFEE